MNQYIIPYSYGCKNIIINKDLYLSKNQILLAKYSDLIFDKTKIHIFHILNGVLRLEYCQELFLPFLEKVKGRDNFLDIWYKYCETIILEPGQSFTLQTNMAHRFTSNDSFTCTFFEFSTTHKDSDSYRLLKGD